jgi:orotate phosphoribosyltransferase
MTPDDILHVFTEADAILRGHFVLSSGLRSDTYLQCARVMMDAKRGELLCAVLAEKLRATLPTLPDVVVAPAMGGVIVGYEMGRQLRMPTMFCERVEGNFTLRRGFTLKKGQTVLLVEDVVTTGKSSLETVACIEAYGASVVAEVSLIDRSGGTHGLPFPLISLLTLDVATYAPDALPPHLQAIPAVKPGSRGLSA